MKRKKLIILIAALLASVVALMAVAAVFCHFNPDKAYVIRRKVELIFVGELPEKTNLENVETYTLDELLSKENVTFNEALALINEEYPCNGRVFEVSEYKDTELYMNVSALEDYKKLAAAVMEETGDFLYISSAYRTYDEQVEIYQEDTDDVAAKPGTSEHESGLAVDVYVKGYAGYGFTDSKAGQFVNSDCWKYGFIIRYPWAMEDVTGIRYEPWHIRYVGAPHAEIMHKNLLCLEEYVKLFKNNKLYSYGDYIISVVQNGEFKLPVDFESATVSEIYDGTYMLTVKL